MAAQLRRMSRPIGQNDMMIAAIAMTLGSCIVVTMDSDLSAVPGLVIENWPTEQRLLPVDVAAQLKSLGHLQRIVLNMPVAVVSRDFKRPKALRVEFPDRIVPMFDRPF
jgi:hypothetical protein